MAENELSAEEVARYARQIGPGVLSTEGQLRLKDSTALVTRTGGMGGPAAMCLVMAGVGRVIIAHGGELISPDLNRQVLGSEGVLGKPRAPHFAEALRSMNRFVAVEAIDHEPDDAEALELARRSDVVLSCPPGFEERMRLNRAAVEAGVPLIDAAQWGMSGTLLVVDPGQPASIALTLTPYPPEVDELVTATAAVYDIYGNMRSTIMVHVLYDLWVFY
jgi:molybdopterin/thiamine biosynthesis adenylyltransferase